MKNFSKFLFALLAAVFLALPLQGCKQDEIALTAYKSIQSSGITYNLVMEAAADMKASGTLSEAQWTTLCEAALVYYDAYQLAVSSLSMYVGVLEATDGEAPTADTVQELVAAVSSSIGDLLTCAVSLGISVNSAVGGDE